jgi:hypothetical protein
MNKLFKKASLGVALAMALGASSAWADFLTDVAQVQLTTGGTTQPNVITINGISGIGDTFTNSVTSNAIGTSDADVRVIGANYIQSYGLTPAGQLNPATYNDLPIVAVYAEQGYTTASATNSIFPVTSGAIAFFTIDQAVTGSFDQYDPSTWGVVSGGGGLATPLAVYSVVAPDNLIAGTGASSFTPQPASAINKTALNIVSQTSTQGYTLTQENEALVSPVAPDPGVSYIEITDPSGVPSDGEGLAIKASSSLDFGTTGNTVTDIASTLQANLGILDTIGQVLGGFASLGGGHYFATSVCAATAACFGDGAALALASEFLDSVILPR